MSSRIYYSEQLRRYADEHIEMPFRQIQQQSLSDEDRAAVPVLLDDYGRMYLGRRYHKSIANGFCSRLQAMLWASQFGRVHHWHDGARHYAQIQGHAFVWAPTQQEAYLLAGIQVLRERSIFVLNRTNNEKMH